MGWRVNRQRDSDDELLHGAESVEVSGRLAAESAGDGLERTVRHDCRTDCPSDDVYIEETDWKVGDKSWYTWMFSTSRHVLFRCGVSRKKSEATDVLGDLATIVTKKSAAKAQPPVEPTVSHVATVINLQRELAGNVECLFVFVEHPEVEPTNSRSERHLRREAEIRKGARTSKAAAGAKRCGAIVTVFASLQTRITNFTLANTLANVER